MASAVGTQVRQRTRNRPRALDIPTGTMEVTRAGYGGDSEEAETIQVPKFEGEAGRVRVEGSITRNMGDYNSIRIGVSVEMPCYPSEHDVDRCYDWCSAKVEDKIQNELRIAVGEPDPVAPAGA